LLLVVLIGAGYLQGSASARSRCFTLAPPPLRCHARLCQGIRVCHLVNLHPFVDVIRPSPDWRPPTITSHLVDLVHGLSWRMGTAYWAPSVRHDDRMPFACGIGTVQSPKRFGRAPGLIVSVMMVELPVKVVQFQGMIQVVFCAQEAVGMVELVVDNDGLDDCWCRYVVILHAPRVEV
jgi:hypothetical protein